MFNIDICKDIQFKESSFENLVYSENKKRIVRKLMGNHTNNAKLNIIDNKNAGLIFLL